MIKKQMLYVVLVLFCLPLQAQVEKGKWLLSPATFIRGWAAQNGEGVSQHSDFISFKLLYFPANRLALGGQFQYASFYADQNANLLEDRVSWWLMPTLRYYLSQPAPEKRLRIFAEAGGTIFFDQKNNDPKLKAWGGIAGIGANYFVNDLIAVELIAAGQYRTVRREIALGSSNAEGVFDPNLQLGLRFFLQPSFEKKTIGSTEKAQWLFGAWIDLNADDDGALNRHPFFVRGRAAYFVTPSLAAGIEGGIDLGGDKLSSLTIFSDWEAASFLRYYIPTTRNVQFFPEVGYGFSEDIYKGVDSSKARTFKAGLGVHTFFNERISLEYLLSYRRHKFYMEGNEPSPIQQNSLGLDFNLTYFLFSR